MVDAHEIHVVAVLTDDLPRAKSQLWLAAVRRDEAVTAVLDAVSEGWTARLAVAHLPSAEAKALRMSPGTVRKLSR
jgi:hypothetical protein